MFRNTITRAPERISNGAVAAYTALNVFISIEEQRTALPIARIVPRAGSGATAIARRLGPC
ncbi:hypothetical protein [Burkholderia latens]|uniref:Uncharacterized protein n=1 Tax=Burkholderia latens TaxID=488446 RepID=A0A6H9SQA8_9BURK|nr:hypothetical protein [Burkholderia latens]KAB0643103.1 hypothetical protein F7R21_08765 [Burkholderia latens]